MNTGFAVISCIQSDDGTTCCTMAEWAIAVFVQTRAHRNHCKLSVINDILSGVWLEVCVNASTDSDEEKLQEYFKYVSLFINTIFEFQDGFYVVGEIPFSNYWVQK